MTTKVRGRKRWTAKYRLVVAFVSDPGGPCDEVVLRKENRWRRNVPFTEAQLRQIGDALDVIGEEAWND